MSTAKNIVDILLENDIDAVIRARLAAHGDEVRRDVSLSDLNALKNFSALNTRRNALIDKKYAAGLTPQEAEEFANLQRLAGLYRILGNNDAG